MKAGSHINVFVYYTSAKRLCMALLNHKVCQSNSAYIYSVQATEDGTEILKKERQMLTLHEDNNLLY